jgi:adenylate kinase
MIVIIMGAPGCGKGTQCSLLSQNGFTHFSTGDLLRQEIQNKSAIGHKVEAILAAGKLVSDIMMEPIIANFLQKNYAEDIILDGYPRTLAQAETLSLLDKNNIIKKVLHLDVPRSELIKRLSGRLVCSACGASYHKEFNKPKHETICDRCSGRLYVRDDDKIEKINKRLSIYDEQTKPVLDYYINRDMLKTIDAIGKSEDIKSNILLSLGLC